MEWMWQWSLWKSKGGGSTDSAQKRKFSQQREHQNWHMKEELKDLTFQACMGKSTYQPWLYKNMVDSNNPLCVFEIWWIWWERSSQEMRVPKEETMEWEEIGAKDILRNLTLSRQKRKEWTWQRTLERSDWRKKEISIGKRPEMESARLERIKGWEVQLSFPFSMSEYSVSWCRIRLSRSKGKQEEQRVKNMKD